MTANFNAERSIMIQEKINNGFLTLSQKQLTEKLTELGHRFPNKRAEYIFEARKYKDTIKDTMKSSKTDKERRRWLVKNVKGLGFKEAGHFLRNIGYTDVAIVDFHIIDLLERYKLIKKPRTLTPANYIKIEKTLEKLANKVNLNLAELDLYLWYLETGKVLK